MVTEAEAEVIQSAVTVAVKVADGVWLLPTARTVPAGGESMKLPPGLSGPPVAVAFN